MYKPMADETRSAKRFSKVVRQEKEPVFMPDPMQVLSSDNSSSPTVVLKADYVGSSDNQLAHQLLHELMAGLFNLDTVPEAIIFYHQAVKLLLEDSPVISELQKLQQEGTELLACELSLKQYANGEPELGFTVSFQELILQLAKAKKVLWF